MKLLEAAFIFAKTPIHHPSFLSFTFFQIHQLQTTKFIFHAIIKNRKVFNLEMFNSFSSLIYSLDGVTRRGGGGRRREMVIHRLVIELKLGREGVEERNHVPSPTRNSLSNI